MKNKNKIHPISNINISIKILTIILMFLTSSFLLFFAMVKSVSNSEEECKSETENVILTATEQYINSYIENIVSVATTVYANSSLYRFLNKEYSSPAEYYDAFYEMEENNSLSISKTSSIKNFTIYTENPTIMNGGNIMNLSGYKDSLWYKNFLKLNKSLIIYFDKNIKEFSLIRKLDYESVNTGECYLKIDFNEKTINDYFKNLNFNGNFYIMSEGILLFSNTGEKNVNITPDYKCYIKNYYTTEIEYYVYQKNHSFSDIISENIFYIIPFLFFLILSIIVSVIIVYNIVSRTKKFTFISNSDKELAKIKDISVGNDEIGIMFKNCISFFDRLEIQKREYKKCNEILEQCQNDAKRLLLQSLNSDAEISFLLKDNNKNSNFSESILLKEEIKFLKKHFNDNNYDIKIVDLTKSDKISILNHSICIIANDIINHLNTVRFSDNDKNLSVVFLTDTPLNAGKILKLRAIFEDYSNQTNFDFKSGYQYNPYLRIKNYYGTNISIDISSEEKSFAMILKIKL